MTRWWIATALALACIAPQLAEPYGLEEQGTACGVTTKPGGKLASAKVAPAGTGGSNTYAFQAGGQTSVNCGSSDQPGLAFNLGYGAKWAGTWNEATKTAQETFTLSLASVGPWPKGAEPNLNGTHTFASTVTCPSDPWLDTVSCAVQSTQNNLGSALTLKGPYPKSPAFMSPAERVELRMQKAWIEITAPVKGQQIPTGADVIVQLKKHTVPGMATQQVKLTFSQGGSQWAGLGAFTRVVSGTSVVVAGSEFKGPGGWEVSAQWDWTGMGIALPPGVPFTIVGVAGPKSPVTATKPSGPMTVAPGPIVVPPPPPPPGGSGRQMTSLPARPLQLLSAQQQGADQLLLVLGNPAGSADTAEQTVEIKLASRGIGRGRLRGLAGGGQERLVVRFELPPGTRGPVELEVWAGGARIGGARVSPLVRAR